ncbi:MAG: site-specific integrase [Bacteroidota bacterium]|jgi:integrase
MRKNKLKAPGDKWDRTQWKHLDKYLYRMPNGMFVTEMVEVVGERKKCTRFETRAEAEVHILETQLAKRNGGLGGRPVRYRMLDAIEDFKSLKIAQRRRKGTIKRYQPIMEQLRIFVQKRGIEYVDQFSPDLAIALFKALTAPRKDPKGNTVQISVAEPKTVNIFVNTVKSVFKEEVLRGHITTNPMAHCPRLKAERKKPEFYTREELTAFFAISMDIAYRRAFMGLLLTGMRVGELTNLRIEDIDMESGHVHVRPYDGFDTKTHNAERKIPMGEDLRALISDILDDPLSDMYPFASPQGHQLRERSLLSVCKRIGRTAGLTCRMFLHKFRHTHATWLIQRGVPLEDIKELLGHSSIKETEIYAHHRPDDLHHQVRKLDGLLSGKKGPHG